MENLCSKYLLSIKRFSFPSFSFSILLYHLLTLNGDYFTPIVKDFSAKLRKKTNFSEKTDKYTTRKSKCFQMVLF